MRRLLALGLVCFIPLVCTAEPSPLRQVCLDKERQVCAYEANPEAAQAVVLVHGLNGEARHDWEQQIPVLADSYHVLSIQLPGFELEGQDAALYSLSHFSDIIHRFAQRYLDDGPYYLVGHSLGGAIALRHALHYPDRVQRLILADVAGMLHRISYTREMVGHWARGGTGEHAGFAGFLEKMTMKLIATGETLPGGEGSAYDMVLENSTDPQTQASMQLARQNHSGQLLGMWVPTLLIWGEEDPVAPLRTAYALNARLPNARLQLIPGARHMPMREVPELFNRALLGFLQADRALPGDNQRHRIPQGVSSSNRVAICRDQEKIVYEGDYERIELYSCERVVIRNARVTTLKVYSSRLSILHSAIGTAERPVALEANGSDIKITASDLHGEVPIKVSGSRIDLAGTTLFAREVGVRASGGSDLVFSISELRHSGGRRYLHGFFELEFSQTIPANE